jgi:RHS repeat-associated protein
MGTSSARPDDLDSFASGARELDGELVGDASRLGGAYDRFTTTCHWGVLDASSLVDGYKRYPELNESDAAWVANIAASFRRAGGSGDIVSLPDAAVAASLRQAGLSDTRAALTFDSPTAYGFPPTTGFTNDPVNTASGNFVEREEDLVFGGLLERLLFARTYNSRSEHVGAFGRGWSCWADARLIARAEGAEYAGPDGQRALFGRQGGGYDRVVGVAALVEPLKSGLALHWFGSDRWLFDDAGRPVLLDAGPGRQIRMTHDAEGRLVELAHAAGRRVALEWSGDRIVAAAASDGRRVTYEYDDEGHLVAAEQSGAARRYGIGEDGLIASVTDADGVVEAVNRYDEEGRVVEQLSPFGRRTRLSYLPGRVTVTSDDQGGPPNTFIHDVEGRLLAIVDGDDERLSCNYDQWGNPVLITTRGGGVTIQQWDERSRLVRRVLPAGATLTYAYDDADRMVESACSTGALTRMRYVGAERFPVEVVDPEGGVTAFTVEDGVVKAIVDPDGVRLRFEHDRDVAVVAAIDADGNATRVERDTAGRVTATISPLGRRTELEHDEHGRIVARRDPSGGTWRYEHTSGGRLSAVIDPGGAREEVRYGEHGHPVEWIDALGQTTSERHDIFGNLIASTDPVGATTRYEYDALMRLTTIIDSLGGSWRQEYDPDGNLVATLDPAGARRSRTFDPAGRLTAIHNGLAETSFAFDELGRPIEQRRPDGASVRCEYDHRGLRTLVEDALGGRWRWEHSPGGRLLRTVAPSGRDERYEYDRCGRPSAFADGAGRRWRLRHDADGALVARVAPNGETTRLVYDEAGRLAEWSAPGHGTMRYGYDAVGRTILIEDRDSGARRFEYDAGGRLVAATDANGAATRYAHDAAGRLIEVIDPLGAVTRREYDATGQPTRIVDPLGRVTTFAYDAAGRLVEQDDGSDRRGRWSYDAAGRVRTFDAGGLGPVTIERDVLGREVAIEEPGLPAIGLEWDLAGRLVERRRGDVALRWSYDSDGQRTGLDYPDGTSLSYAYDAGGVLSELRHPSLGAVAFDRDPAGRLVEARANGMSARWRFGDGGLAEYAFDAEGTSRSALLERDGVGRIVAATVDGDRHGYAYDPAGQLLAADSPGGAFSFAYDACGRLERETSPAGAVAYEHDAAAQLTRRRDANGATTQYAYDGAGRRVRESDADLSRCWEWDEQGRLRAIRSQPSGEDERTTTVVVDALGELAEVDGSALLWDSADPLAPLAWLNEQAVVGAGAPWALAGSDAATWLAPDWQGTIGMPRDPWGASSGGGEADAKRGPHLGYRGELEFAGDVWLRARVYEPASRTLLSRDPLPAIAGTPWAANPYSYAGDNPIGLSDPLGRRPITDAEIDAIRERQIADNASGFNLMDVVHGALDVAGFIPGLGAAADVLNAGIYALEGDYANAALSLLASVPGVGDAAALGKMAIAVAVPLAKVAKHGDEVGPAALVAVKRGPKPFGTGPHNIKIKEVADSVGDGRVVAGGQTGLPEAVIRTPDGLKSSRRPDILVERLDGSQYGINVGKQSHRTGAPIKREIEAINDLEAADVPMHFVPYN